MYNIRASKNPEVKSSRFVGRKRLEKPSVQGAFVLPEQEEWKSVSRVMKLRMARAPLVSRELLRILALDEDADVRLAVAERGDLSSQLQTILCLDKSPDIRFVIAEDPATAVSILRRLSQDENPYVAHRAQRTLFALAREAIREPACFFGGSIAIMQNSF